MRAKHDNQTDHNAMRLGRNHYLAVRCHGRRRLQIILSEDGVPSTDNRASGSDQVCRRYANIDANSNSTSAYFERSSA